MATDGGWHIVPTATPHPAEAATDPARDAAAADAAADAAPPKPPPKPPTAPLASIHRVWCAYGAVSDATQSLLMITSGGGACRRALSRASSSRDARARRTAGRSRVAASPDG